MRACPSLNSIAALEAAAAQNFRLGAGAGCVAAPGTQSLIQLLPRVYPAKKVAILGFTYAEHESVWAASGAEVKIHDRLDDLAGANAAVIVNPNNPDGRLVGPNDLLRLARQLSSRGKILIVDEAFVDFLPREASLAPLLPLPGAVVLRSFGKTYGLAGLRLGFALGEAGTMALLRQKLGPWAVSGAAVEIGLRAYADDDWLARSAARLHKDGARLDALLLRSGFALLGGAPLFRLARHARADAIFRRLGEGGALVRPFAARPEWLRFGVPHADADFDRLELLLRGA